MAESKRAVVRKGDLTEGGIVSKLTLFALPLIAGNIVNQLYNVADLGRCRKLCGIWCLGCCRCLFFGYDVLQCPVFSVFPWVQVFWSPSVLCKTAKTVAGCVNTSFIFNTDSRRRHHRTRGAAQPQYPFLDADAGEYLRRFHYLLVHHFFRYDRQYDL